MFNYSAEQIFVIQPHNTCGGLLSFLLSLDSQTSTIDFKKISLQNKLNLWQDYVKKTTISDAHLAGFVNVGSANHTHNIHNADFCNRYIHKNHFYELDSLNDNKCHPFLDQLTGEKKSIGIYLTDNCIEKLLALRPNTSNIDFYQKWVYSNQKILLKEFYGISTLHYFSYSEVLDKDMFIDHLTYCKDLLNLDINIDISATLIDQWYRIIKHVV